MTTKFFKKILFTLIVAAFIAMISLTINTLAKSAKAQSGITGNSDRFELHGSFSVESYGTYVAICDTGNGAMIYAGRAITVLPDGCNKK